MKILSEKSMTSNQPLFWTDMYGMTTKMVIYFLKMLAKNNHSYWQHFKGRIIRLKKIWDDFKNGSTPWPDMWPLNKFSLSLYAVF